MSPSAYLALPILFFILAPQAEAYGLEQERLSGFAQHQKKNEGFDAARMSGESDYYAGLKRAADQRLLDLQEYKKLKRQATMSEEGPEAKVDAAEKMAFQESYEKEQFVYTQEQKKQKAFSRDLTIHPSESQELGLSESAPRFDYRKRALYGGKAKFGNMNISSGTSGGSFGSGGSSGTSFPPPPSMEDFGGNDNSYVPAPNMQDDFGDVPPPPPPPPMPMDETGGMDFPAPIPPPAPPFNEGGGF